MGRQHIIQMYISNGNCIQIHTLFMYSQKLTTYDEKKDKFKVNMVSIVRGYK